MSTKFALTLLGVGNAAAHSLGNASAVVEQNSSPTLLLDCGFDTLNRFQARYGSSLPSAIFITHGHLDHIGGLEGLFFRALRTDRLIRLFVPVTIVALLHDRLATYPGALAEDGVNFWDRFQLIPVSDEFWHEGLRYEVFETRHHRPRSSYGLRLRHRFVWTGDTRPIPETLSVVANAGERVFHDCALEGNPSHTGVDDLLREYSVEFLRRLVAYHYESEHAAARLREHGLSVAQPGERFELGEVPTSRHPHTADVLNFKEAGDQPDAA